MNKPFAFRVMYSVTVDDVVETDLSVTGWTTDDIWQETLMGVYEIIHEEGGEPYYVFKLKPGQFFDDGPARLGVVH